MATHRLDEVRARIAEAARRAGRAPEDVTLVAVTKTRPVETLRALAAAGQLDLGENRADDLSEKAAALAGLGVRWHFVGNLQRNKLKLLREIRPLVHSFDRPDLAEAWPRGLDVLLQVNVAGEAQKNGLAPAEVGPALAALEKAGVRCPGLSTMPPLVEDARKNRPHFRALRAMRDDLSTSWPALRALSMGTTADYAVAVEEGATMVRVGRALFEPA